MATNYTDLKGEIKAQIKPNGVGAITGQVLQDAMLNLVGATEAELSALNEVTDAKLAQLDQDAVIAQDSEDAIDLNITDEAGNSLAQFAQGHIKTKKFDSRNITNAKAFKEKEAGYIRFKVQVNQTPLPMPDSNTTSSATSSTNDVAEMADCTGVLALPSSYSATGEPCRLVLFAHGGHGYVDDTHWYPTNASFPALVQALNDAGYAVFDCNGYKDTPYDEWLAIVNRGDVQISEGLPQVVEAYWKCYQHIISNYNVLPEVYIWGCSQGGHLAMNFAYTHRQAVACIAMCAGQIDLYNQGYLYQTTYNRQQVAKLLGFANQDGSDGAYDHRKADIFDPMQRIVTINNTDYVLGWNAPIKFFYGTADTTLPQFDYTIRMVNALQNSKAVAYMRWYTGLNHDDVAVGKNAMARQEIIEWFNRF